MFAANVMGAGASAAGDPYWANVVFLAGFDTSATLDESASAGAMTATAVLGTTNKFGGKSLSFDNTTNKYARLNTEITLSQRFTVEAWVYCNDTGDQFVASGINNNCQLIRLNETSAGVVSFFINGYSMTSAAGKFSTGAWNHFALCRSDTGIGLYVNGVLAISGATTNAAAFGVVGNFSYMGSIYGSYYFNGFIDEVRVTNGVARYTSNFSVPTAAFPRN